MDSRDGHAEVDWLVDSIKVGYRHRQHVGDLEELCASIQQLGLLQPITISTQGTLLCGARRLAAVKHLGWRTVKVWVCSRISTPMERLLAEQHENTMRAELTPTEAAALYRELKDLMAEGANRRQRATRFGAGGGDAEADSKECAGQSGGAAAAPPSEGKTRAQAAELVTGQKSYTKLEQVSELQELAGDENAPEQFRLLAQDALAQIEAEGKVKGPYATVKAAQTVARLDELAADPDQPAFARRQAAREAERLRSHQDLPAAELLRQSKLSLDRAKSANPGKASGSHVGRKLGPRAFVVFWTELYHWTDEYDPTKIGPALTEEQWGSYEATVSATVNWTDRARQARNAVV